MPKKFQVIVNAAKNDTEQNEILVHGPIGASFWDDSGISGKDFTDALNQFPKGTKVTIGVNSQGGAVGEGLAIFNAIQRRAEDITVRIDGYAISIASVFPLAASKVVSPKSSIWMIHNAWSYAGGNAKEMRKQADVLDTHDETLVSAYVDSSKKRGANKTEKEFKNAMSEETWLTGEEAVAWGLADESGDKDLSAALNQFDFSKAPQGTFRNVPANFMAMASFKNLPTQGGGGTNNQKPNTQPAASHGGTTSTMKKENIVALLKTQGIEASIDETIEALEAKLTQALAKKPAASGDNGDVKAQLEKVMAQLNKEREQRISLAVDQLVVENRLTVDAAKEWLPQCIANESILASLKKLPQVLDGASPVRISGGDRVARASINEKAKGKERFKFLENNWNELVSAGVPIVPVYNANTLDTALTTDMLNSGVIEILQNRLPMLAGFTRDFGTDRLKPNAVVQVPIENGGGTAQTNATDFEDTTNFVAAIDNVPVTAARITSGSHLTAAQLNSGFRMAQFVRTKTGELADKIQNIVNAIITTSNFTATPIVSASGAFGQSEMNAAWAAIAKSGTKNVMLHQDYYKQLLPGTLENFNVLANNIPGWDLVALNTYWTGAGSDIVGLACGENAIAVASGLPLASPNRAAAGTLAQAITIPNLGLTVELQQWYSNKTKTDWANWEVMFGAAKGDGNAAVVFKSQ